MFSHQLRYSTSSNVRNFSGPARKVFFSKKKWQPPAYTHHTSATNPSQFLYYKVRGPFGPDFSGERKKRKRLAVGWPTVADHLKNPELCSEGISCWTHEPFSPEEGTLSHLFAVDLETHPSLKSTASNTKSRIISPDSSYLSPRVQGWPHAKSCC